MQHPFTNTPFKIGQPVYVMGYPNLYRIEELDRHSNDPVYYLSDRDGNKGSAYGDQLIAFKSTQKEMRVRIRLVSSPYAIKIGPKSGIRRSQTAQTKRS